VPEVPFPSALHVGVQFVEGVALAVQEGVADRHQLVVHPLVAADLELHQLDVLLPLDYLPLPQRNHPIDLPQVYYRPLQLLQFLAVQPTEPAALRVVPLGEHRAELDDALVFLVLGLLPILQFLVVELLRNVDLGLRTIGSDGQLLGRLVVLLQYLHVLDRVDPQFLL
jgi:hypothetical protein